MYSTEEIWVENGSCRIYGIAHIPDTDGKKPAVIFSHELGSSHESGIPYAERLAEAGYAAYTFDYPGGSTLSTENRSGGDTAQMSVMTEASDLEAVIEAAKSWDFVDPDRIVLLGGSQGGMAATIAGAGHGFTGTTFEEAAGYILDYMQAFAN